MKLRNNKFFWLRTNFEDDPGGGDDDTGGGGGGGTDVAEWAQGFENEDVKTTLGKFEDQGAFFKSIGYEPPKPDEKDWRDGMDDDTKKTADRFNSPTDAMRAIEDLRKSASLPRIPGKDASDEDQAKFRTAMGIPEAADGYEWPEVAEELMTDELKASREVWGTRFHEMGISKENGKLLATMVNEDAAKANEAIIAADKEFADESEKALRTEWKSDFDKNKELANRAVEAIAKKAGVNLEDLTKVETKDGRYLLDRSDMMRLWSAIGREMDEGSLGPALTSSEAESIDEEIKSLREQQSAAQAKGNNKLANELYNKEQVLIAKKSGNQPVVGAGGRTV